MIPPGMLATSLEVLARIFPFRNPHPLARAVTGILVALATLPINSRADDIYLRNGRKIVGTVIREDARQIIYESGDGEYTLPRALVDRVERSTVPTPDALPGESPQARRKEDLPLPPPRLIDTTDDASLRVIKDNSVDDSQLQRLDDEVLRNSTDENRYRLALGYRQAGAFLTRAGKPQAAIDLYRHALNFAPANLHLTLALGYLLLIQKHYSEAVDLLLPASMQFPKSPDIPMLLGSAYYYTENLDRAIAEWRESLALHDDSRVREALERAEQERNVAGSYQEMRSVHFLLHYQGAEVKPLAEQVLSALDADFKDLEGDLDVYPNEMIVVLLYPDQAFNDITRLPSWAGAVNDGKIRIPVSGLSSMTPELKRVLKHELTHSFVYQATLGRCPVWFNEGLAQLEEGSTTVTGGALLARAWSSGRTIPFNDLETSFLELPKDQVALAYAKSLAALEYLRDTYGMAEIRRLLTRMATNPDINSLLQDELRLNYPALEQDVATYVEKRYGS